MPDKVKDAELSSSGIILHASPGDIQRLAESIAWKDVEAMLLLFVVESRNNLEVETDGVTITFTQGKIAAYRHLLNLPNALLEDKKEKELKGEESEPE